MSRVRPSHLLIQRVRGQPGGHRDRILTADQRLLPPRRGYAARPGRRTRPLMYHTSEHVTPRRSHWEAPYPGMDRSVENDGAKSLAVRAPCSDRPLWSMTTDPAPTTSSRGMSAADLAGTPCGMENPRDRVHRSTWGRLQHTSEVRPSLATWGRSLLVKTPKQALKVRTWGRTTEARFSTWNPAGDVPNRPPG